MPDSSPSPPSVRKRALSNASSTASKRQNSEPPALAHSPSSDTEGSLGASHLTLDRSPTASPDLNDITLDANMDDPAQPPPAYDEPAPSSPSPLLALPPTASNLPEGFSQTTAVFEVKRSALMEWESGDVWYLIARSWYRRWQTAASGVLDSKDDDDLTLDLTEVGPIDNSSLLESDGTTLKKPLEDGRDVEVLPRQAWEMLVSWYGSVHPPIERAVVKTGGYGSERVEFYPPVFRLLLLLPTGNADSTTVVVPNKPTPPTTSLHSDVKLSSLKQFAATEFNLTRPVRLWRLPTPTSTTEATPTTDSATAPQHEEAAFVFVEDLQRDGSELIDTANVTDDSTLVDALLVDPETRLAVEQQSEDGTWLVDATTISNSGTGSLSASSTTTAPPETEGKKTLFGSNFFDKFAAKNAASSATGANVLTPKYKSSSNSLKATPIHPPSNNQGTITSFMSGIGGALTRSKSHGRNEGQRGLTGLQNLGNTCFMNSALQCMSNTKELQEYFNSGVYKSEINRDNPLGMHGQVAEGFGQLIERLWASSGSSVAPREFKQALARFAPQFSGYGQQDSQELLAFLLDGVHEDLNRIKKKPATEAPDWEGGGDKELVEMAKTCWEQYRSRNDSVIVDLFQGQYRSTVVCPDCDKVSITFDPFMYVTTNLPITKKWSGLVHFVPLDPSKPRYSIELEVPKNGTLKTLKTLVGKHMNVDPKNLIITEEWHSKFWKSWFDDDMISELDTSRDNIIIFETSHPFAQAKPRFYGKTKPASAAEPAPDTGIVVTVIHSMPSKIPVRRTFGSSRDAGDEFGLPILLTLTPTEASSVAGITNALAQQYARVTVHGAELLECIALEDELAAAQPKTAATSAPVVPPPVPSVVSPPASTIPLPATPPPEGDMEVDRDSVASTSDVPLEESTPAPSTSAGAPPTSAPLADPLLPPPVAPAAAPQPTAHVPHRPFRIFVANKGKQVPLANADFSGTPVPLESRVKSAGAPVSDFDMFAPSTSKSLYHVPGSFNGPEEDESAMSTDTELDTASLTTTETSTTPAVDESIDGTPLPPSPLVRVGDYLVVEWDPAALAHFFGKDGTGEPSQWKQVETFVDPVIAEARSRPRGTAKKVITLEDCLTEFTKEERLGEDDTWYCPTCKKHQRATKKVEIWKAPDVLVFALKRFSSNRYSRDKLDDLVDFPVEGFDMSQFVEGDKVEKRLAGEGVEMESLVYDLYAVDNHYGGMGGGHYTAYAKNPENGKWYDFDDSRVSEINSSSIKTKAGYLLFYRRRTARPIGAKSRELIESAIQSRNVSASASDAGVPSPRHGPTPISAQPSPFASTDNLAAFTDQTDDDELYGPRTYTQADHSPPFDQRFTGMFNAPYRNLSDTEADAGSSRSSHSRPLTPDEDNWMQADDEESTTEPPVPALISSIGADLPSEDYDDEAVELALDDLTKTE